MNTQITILVTGVNGQIGSEIKNLAKAFPYYHFLFTARNDLDITDKEAVIKFFSSGKIDYCINCAAYTAVDKAESENQKAYDINVTGVENLASACKENNAGLIHFSTDYVYNGKNNRPYLENDPVNPLNIYGSSKLEGENRALEICSKTTIIRTSWVYSSFGNNFVKSMLHLGSKNNILKIVSDQIGTPTYAADIANSTLKIISQIDEQYGIYHFTNEGVASWYDFAKAIFELKETDVKLEPILTKDFSTDAIRPFYSVLDKSKIRNKFALQIPYWRDSLRICLNKI